MRLIVGGNFISFHSDRISITDIKHRETRTVPLESQLVLESELELLLHAAQNAGQIACKLGKVKYISYLSQRKPNFPTDPRIVS